MNGPDRNRRRRFVLVLAPLLLGSVAIPAARSDAEEEKKVSSNTVAEGLKTIQRAGEDAAKQAGENKAEAEKSLGVITPVWSMIESTIRANDEKSYEALEHAVEDLAAAATAGDAKQAGDAAKALASAIQSYAPKADGAPAAGSPRSAASASKPAAAAPKEAAGSADRTAAAAEAGDATLARTGPASGLTALAGAAFGLGGLALIGGARRRVTAAG